MEKENSDAKWGAVAVGVVVLLLTLGALGYSYNKQQELNNNTDATSSSQTSNQSPVNQPQETPAPVVQPPKTTVQTPTQKPVKTPTSNISYELSENPNYLFSQDFNPNKVKVYGVSIGDLESSINPSSIKQQPEYFGWIHTLNGTGYRIANGIVVEIAMNNAAEKLGIYSESNIIVRFGQPDRIDTTSDYYLGNTHYIAKSYYYISRGLVVNYNEGGGIFVSINITGKY